MYENRHCTLRNSNIVEMNSIIDMHAIYSEKTLNILTNIMLIDQVYTNLKNSSTLNDLVLYKKICKFILLTKNCVPLSLLIF